MSNLISSKLEFQKNTYMLMYQQVDYYKYWGISISRKLIRFFVAHMITRLKNLKE